MTLYAPSKTTALNADTGGDSYQEFEHHEWPKVSALLWFMVACGYEVYPIMYFGKLRVRWCRKLTMN